MNCGLQAIAECERALALDRNLAAAHAAIGLAKIFIGRAEESEGHVREALRISPRDTFAFNWLATAGLAKLYVATTKRPWLGFVERSKSTGTSPTRIFTLLPPWPISAGSRRHIVPQRRGSRSIQATQSVAFALPR